MSTSSNGPVSRGVEPARDLLDERIRTPKGNDHQYRNNQKPMENIGPLTLLKGRFTPEEAREVLINLFQAKVSFHQMKDFSSLERTGREDHVAKERIIELKESMRRIKEMVTQADRSGMMLSVSSTVQVELVDAQERSEQEGASKT